MIERAEFTTRDVLILLYREIARAGSQKAWAEQNGVSEAYVCDVLKSRREPGVSILNALGLEKIVTYAEKAR